MEKQGVVSLWLGNFKNAKNLNEFMRETYNNDGDISSLFIEKIEVEYLDNQFQEVDFYQNKKNKKIIFEGFSYIYNLEIKKYTNLI